ncbi:HpcH/HpaI aldolase/citrate lyase family protein [Streptomyces sp. NPDC002920]
MATGAASGIGLVTACRFTLDGVTTAVDDEPGLTADTAYAAVLGFTGKLCIHPCQVPVVHTAFAPSREERERAREIVDAAGDGSVAVVRPHDRQARPRPGPPPPAPLQLNHPGELPSGATAGSPPPSSFPPTRNQESATP